MIDSEGSWFVVCNLLVDGNMTVRERLQLKI